MMGIYNFVHAVALVNTSSLLPPTAIAESGSGRSAEVTRLVFEV